jgi:rod shape-determining protein MreC
MGVVTPDGIVGKVIASYPTASEVLLMTDPEFAAGVISQNGGVRGTLKGQGNPMCRVDYVPLEEKVQVGEWFYTSGDDRIFPRGFPVGVVKVVRDTQPFKEILLEPAGLTRGVEDVLIVVQGVHQDIPSTPPANQPVYIAPGAPAMAAPATGSEATEKAPLAGEGGAGTEADRLRSLYKSVGEAQNHTYGVGPPGTKPPDFTRLPASGNGAVNPAPPSAAAPAAKTPAGGMSSEAAPRPPVGPRLPKPADTPRKANPDAGAPPPTGLSPGPER